jgi:ornithine cyclodeaminase/alanine dehydrogenase-like protein (mu-crystallin family)
MPLYLTESDVDRLLNPRDVTEALEQVFAAQARGTAVQEPRVRARLGPHVLHTLPGIYGLRGKAGLKTYLSGPAGVRFVTLLFDTATGDLEAVVESARLGQLRTGCATALACRLLGAPPGPLALLGTGTVARGQLEALAAELALEDVRVWSRRPESLQAFVEWAGARGLPCRPVSDVRQAVQGARVVVTATSAAQPILGLEGLEPPWLVCAVGANWAHRREIEADLVRQAELVVVDDVAQARLEAGDLLAVPDLDWDRVVPLARLVLDRPSSLPQRLLFKSLGVALEDLAAASLALDRARSQGLGQPLVGP